MSRFRQLPSLVWIAVGVCVSLCAGCSKEEPRVRVYPVRGEVKYKGQPAVNAHVVFHPTDPNQSFRPHAFVQEDGSFQLSSYVSNDGAPVGTYKVTINWPHTLPGSEDASGEHEGPDLLGGRFTDPNKSPWPVEVKPGPNELAPFVIRE